MKAIFTLFLICFLFPAYAQVNMGGGPGPENQSFPCLTPEQRDAIMEELTENRNELIEKGILSANPSPTDDITKLEWPLKQNANFNDYGYHGISNFVDQDFNFPNMIQDYNCGNRTYDNQNGYNHKGTDYYLWPFRWYKMDHDVVEVVAAAPGVIIGKTDGNFDRSCSFNSNQWNAVYVQHADNSVAWYGHLKNGSITSKNIGESVALGEYLGVVGSSGNSTGPHLHLEIYDSANNLIDPYSGACNGLNSESWWNDQRDYYDSGVNALITQTAAPNFATCPNQEKFFAQTDFQGGETIFLATYYRDQLDTQTSTYTMYKPDGTAWKTWTHNSDATHYSSSYWWWSWVLPFGLDGTWTFEVAYEGETYSTTFNVGIVQSVEDSHFPGYIRIFPNPAKDRLFIRFEEKGYKNSQIILTDLFGKLIHEQEKPNIILNEQIEIPVNNLSVGVYLIHAKLDGEIFRKKVVVE
ncbi:MAG: peptidoglycan DD-metalloendopeptidase family protein [Bacteroidia bacterium]